MHVVLTLPDTFEERLKENKISPIMDLQIRQALKDAVILPKDHGRLIDEGKTMHSLFDYCEGRKTIGQCIFDSPTILGREVEQMNNNKKDVWIAGQKADEDGKLRFGYDRNEEDDDEDYSDEEWED